MFVHVAFRFEYISVMLITKYFEKLNLLEYDENKHEAKQNQWLEPLLQEKFPEGIDPVSGSASQGRAGWPERLEPT